MEIYVDGISEGTTEGDLASLFSGVGSLQAVRVIRDVESGASRGFALVRVANESEGREAIARLNGTTLAGNRLTVFRIHDTLPGEMEFREWLRDHAAEVLVRIGVAKSHKVVDYGCGPGVFSLAAARIVGPAGRVFALDVRPRALDRIKSLAVEDGLHNVETMLIDKAAVSIAFQSSLADVVLLFDVLQEIGDKPGLLGEIHRVLKADGVLSVFPMHLGTQKLLELVDTVGMFRVKDRYCVEAFKSASEIVNLEKAR